MKRNKLNTLGVLMLSSVILVSCATTSHIEKDESVNFENYKTFAWLHGEDGKIESQSDLIESKVRDAVSAELEKSDWKQVNTKPDVLLDYDVLVEKGSKEKSEPVYSQPYSRLIYNPYTRRYASIYYPSRFMGYQSYEELIKEGTITITMIDTKTDKMIWMGWTTEEINSRHLTKKEIQRAVGSIFKKFDVAKR